ncbi:6683_t:CDS:2 [Funneliformis geosporum]|nr:6683_t:CDS:2 [Funneliformis geosporum]
MSDAQENKLFIENYEQTVELFETIKLDPSRNKSNSNRSSPDNLEQTTSVAILNENNENTVNTPIEEVSEYITPFFNFPYYVETTGFDAKNIEQAKCLQHILPFLYGNWSCQWPSKCRNEDGWQVRYSRESLETYRKLSPRLQHGFFTMPCNKCKNRNMISSFLLYDQHSRHLYSEPSIEIICPHLNYFVETTRFREEDIQQITEIVNLLLLYDDFIVYGNWSCQWPRKCRNEDGWQFRYSRESLETYRKLPPRLQHAFFTKPCEKCKNNYLISSFFLYDQPPRNSNSEPTIEIICHLEWNNHYRVIAEWECKAYSHKWHSSYTWISLRKFIEQTPAEDLIPDDYIIQKCFKCKNSCNEYKCVMIRKKCDNCKNATQRCSVCRERRRVYQGCKKCDHDGIIMNYEPLVQSDLDGGVSHKSEVCAKCQGGVYCVQTDYLHRTQKERNINLLN